MAAYHGAIVSNSTKQRVLMVCMGNICRSPMQKLSCATAQKKKATATSFGSIRPVHTATIWGIPHTRIPWQNLNAPALKSAPRSHG